MSELRKPVASLLRRMMGRYEDTGPIGLRIRAWLMRNLPGQLTCVQFEKLIHDYQDESLSPRERRIFDLHMELCPMCRVYVASYLRTIELERQVCAADDAAASAEVPQELVDAILKARSAS